MFRRLGLLIVAVGAGVSWALIAEYLLQIERRDWVTFPVYFLLIVFYWLLAFGAIADHVQDLENPRARWVRGGVALLIALMVFLLLCALLAIPLLG